MTIISLSKPSTCNTVVIPPTAILFSSIFMQYRPVCPAAGCETSLSLQKSLPFKIAQTAC